MQKVTNVITKNGEKSRDFLIAALAVAEIVTAISERSLTLEEAEERAGAEKGCLLKAIEENEMLSGDNFYLLADCFKI